MAGDAGVWEAAGGSLGGDGGWGWEVKMNGGDGALATGGERAVDPWATAGLDGGWGLDGNRDLAAGS